ncbi:hypothetical protein BJX70DRAFT_389392 [Aspergillus crustosus]
MYPWQESFRSWAHGTGLHIDALGLVTLFGAEEMDRSIGRLMPSEYFDYLPLLGAFVVAGDRFTEKKIGYTIYNISAGIMTTELAGWFSRWIQAQDFSTVRSKVTWKVVNRPPRCKALSLGFIFVALPVHGMLVALTVLTADWWGFANVIAMLVSVLVRWALVAQNQAGIDRNIDDAKQEMQKRLNDYNAALEEFEKVQQDNPTIAPPVRPKDEESVKVIVVTQDSKVVTIDAPAYLIRPAFTANPKIPIRLLYLACRVCGWIAFGVHVIGIGMSALHTQICSVLLMIVATVLNVYRVGCEDSQLGSLIRKRMLRGDKEANSLQCWVTPKLRATISSHSVEQVQLGTLPDEEKGTSLRTSNITTKISQSLLLRPQGKGAITDLEHGVSPPQTPSASLKGERRQDLYAWLDLTEDEDEVMVAWGLIPRNPVWREEYRQKKMEYRQLKAGITSKIT